MLAERLLFVYLTWHICFVSSTAASNSTVILIALDGFRWDFISKASTPNLDFIAGGGVKAKYVENVFPTVAMPNLYTIVTGLYPESHGIIANEMFDPDFNATFLRSNNETRWWDGAEPIWVSNQKQGFKSALSYWPGYDVNIGGYLPSFSSDDAKYSKPFVSKDNLMPEKERIDLVMKWLTMKAPPNFIAMYFAEPGRTGHTYGPDSPKTENAIEESDSAVVGYLVEKLRKANLLDKVNVIFTSDHGLAKYNTSDFVNFDDIVNASSYELWAGNGAFLTLEPHSGQKGYVYDRLKEREGNPKRFKVYMKEDVPEKLHFKKNRRIGSVVVLMEKGWYARSSKMSTNLTEGMIKGGQGYSTEDEDMYPFLIARGPAFKKNFSSDSFKLLDIYPMICEILGIKPAPNNGSLARVKQLFGEPFATPTTPRETTESSTSKQKDGNNIVKIVGFAIVGFAVVVFLVASILLTVRWCKRDEQSKKTWMESEETPAIQAEETQALQEDHDEGVTV